MTSLFFNFLMPNTIVYVVENTIVGHFIFFSIDGSGLSSSAAFVCSSTIAIMAAFDVNFPKVYMSGRNH
ncbi:hypothetical protein G4B88_029139 [Cannabis sativa]|uniref:Uncharacterized protein n=1 Tax=Cannabis sativa TaxID=3483 RepID=A0A7J6F0H3_CANSA|nr:hypothetical protein G4B88_029139 [Cannabis sativa]